MRKTGERRRRLGAIAIALSAALPAGCSESGGTDGRGAGPRAEEIHPQLPRNEILLTPVQERALDVKTVTATSERRDHPVVMGGKVSLDLEHTARVRPLLSSTIYEVKKRAGDQVKKGDEILVVESTDLGDAINNYMTTLANLEVAADAYRRQALTRVARAVTENDYQNARNAFQTAVVAAEAAHEKLLLLGVRGPEIERLAAELPLARTLPVDGGRGADDVESEDVLDIAKLVPTDDVRRQDAKRALREIRRRYVHHADVGPEDGRRRARYTIRAPIDGVLLSKDAARGELVDPSQVIATVTDVSRLWINLDVYQRDIPKVRLGARVDVMTPTYADRVFPGEVTYRSENVDDTTHTLRARVSVANPANPASPDDHLLKSGMAAKMIVHCVDEESHIELRPDAIVREGEETYVIVKLGEGHYARRKVKLGFEAEDSVHVEDGVKEGETVVTGGALFIHTEIPLGD